MIDDHGGIVTMHIKIDNHFLVYENNQLIYIGQECSQIPSRLIDYGANTTRLDLSFNCLTSLEGLHHFIALKELILDSNCLDENIRFSYLPTLHTLSLNKNNFADLDRLLTQLVSCFPNLIFLSLLGNIACPNQLSNRENDDDDYARYRRYVIYKLPNLKFLDSTKVGNDERREAVQKGNYLRMIRPTVELLTQNASEESTRNLSPLPSLPVSAAFNKPHSGSFGRMKHRYTGKHSEGNRFIKNNEL